MYCVMWTYQVPPRLTKDLIEKQFNDVADRYMAIPGLIRKYFGLSEGGDTVVGIYLWRSKQAADLFYTPNWMAGVKERWGAEPVRTEWLIPVVTESELGKVITTRSEF
jgi:hypothetical protein